MVFHILHKLSEFGNCVRGVKSRRLDGDHELGSALVVCAEELELAVMERAAQGEEERGRKTLLPLDRVAASEDEA